MSITLESNGAAKAKSIEMMASLAPAGAEVRAGVMAKADQKNDQLQQL